MTQQVWKTTGRFLKKFKIELSCDSDPSARYLSEDADISIFNNIILIFVETLVTKAKMWENLNAH
jgi:hypothetical protein